MKITDVKPCPFCGCPDIEIQQTNPNAIWFQCEGCSAQTDSENNVDDALERWNMRTFKATVVTP